jgi:hypothetical protein
VFLQLNLINVSNLQMTQEKFDDFIEKAYRPFVKMRELLRELEDTVNK